MSNFRTYEFQYNVPAENNIVGRPDLFIEASAQWEKGTYHDDGRPVIINEGPVMSKLTKPQLFEVKNWREVFYQIEIIAQDYFLDQYGEAGKVNVIIHEEIKY